MTNTKPRRGEIVDAALAHPAARYEIQYSAPVGLSTVWEYPGFRRDSGFASESEARAAIESLSSLGDEWASAVWRIVAVRS